MKNNFEEMKNNFEEMKNNFKNNFEYSEDSENVNKNSLISNNLFLKTTYNLEKFDNLEKFNILTLKKVSDLKKIALNIIELNKKKEIKFEEGKLYDSFFNIFFPNFEEIQKVAILYILFIIKQSSNNDVFYYLSLLYPQNFEFYYLEKKFETLLEEVDKGFVDESFKNLKKNFVSNNFKFYFLNFYEKIEQKMLFEKTLGKQIFKIFLQKNIIFKEFEEEEKEIKEFLFNISFENKDNYEEILFKILKLNSNITKLEYLNILIDEEDSFDEEFSNKISFVFFSIINLSDTQIIQNLSKKKIDQRIILIEIIQKYIQISDKIIDKINKNDKLSHFKIFLMFVIIKKVETLIFLIEEEFENKIKIEKEKIIFEEINDLLSKCYSFVTINSKLLIENSNEENKIFFQKMHENFKSDWKTKILNKKD
jgi:hypothetical protein